MTQSPSTRPRRSPNKRLRISGRRSPTEIRKNLCTSRVSRVADHNTVTQKHGGANLWKQTFKTYNYIIGVLGDDSEKQMKSWEHGTKSTLQTTGSIGSCLDVDKEEQPPSEQCVQIDDPEDSKTYAYWIKPYVMDPRKNWMDCHLYVFKKKTDTDVSLIKQWIRLKFPENLNKTLKDLRDKLIKLPHYKLKDYESLEYIAEHEAILNVTLKLETLTSLTYQSQVVIGLVFPDKFASKVLPNNRNDP
jgi:hypothetical protein